MSKPPSLNATLLRTYTRLHFRSARFYTLLFFYLLLMLLVPALVVTNVAPNPGSALALLSLPLGFFVILATLGGALLAGDSISQDFSRQGLFTLSQPIARARFLAARYGAAAIAGTSITLIFFVVGAAETYAFYGIDCRELLGDNGIRPPVHAGDAGLRDAPERRVLPEPDPVDHSLHPDRLHRHANQSRR